MKFIIQRAPDFPDIHVHVSGRDITVQYRGGKDAIKASCKSSALATLFAKKMVFWSELHRDWEIKHLLEHVAWEIDCAVYAARRRVRRSCFAA